MNRRLLFLVLFAVAIAACGGSDEGSSETTEVFVTSPDQSESDEPESEPQSILPTSSDRPDWLPAWVLIPEGFQSTLVLNEDQFSSLTGFVAGGDPQTLYDNAAFMVQSAGFVLTDQAETPNGKTFRAEHTNDGTEINFGVLTSSDPNNPGWSMEFVGLNGPPEETQATNQAPTSRFDTPGTMTATAGGETYTVVGSCEIEGEDGEFVADEGVGWLVVLKNQGQVVGGFGQMPETWGIDARTDEQIEEITINSQFMSFTGEGFRGTTKEQVTVEVDCG